MDLADADVLLAISTTNQKFLSTRFISDDTIRLSGGEYVCFPEDTIISLREIKIFPLAWMKGLCREKKLTFEGYMSSADMTDIDQKLVDSLLIEGSTLKRII